MSSLSLLFALASCMVQALCTDEANPFGPLIIRYNCGPYLIWFWMNFIVDLWFIVDIYLNFRTGFMHEGHLVSDDWLVAKNYLKGS